WLMWFVLARARLALRHGLAGYTAGYRHLAPVCRFQVNGAIREFRFLQATLIDCAPWWRGLGRDALWRFVRRTPLGCREVHRPREQLPRRQWLRQARLREVRWKAAPASLACH